MRETIQVANETKNTMMAFVGSSLWTVMTELLRPPARCDSNKTANADGPKATATQMNKCFRSDRLQPRGCNTLDVVSSADGPRFFNSSITLGPDSSAKARLLPMGF